MSDISKTRYRLLDEVNNRVTIFGFELGVFMIILLGHMIVGFLFFMLLGLIGLFLVLISVIFLFKLGKKMRKLREKGVKDPFSTMLNYNSKTFYFKNNIDIKSIYEDTREQ